MDDIDPLAEFARTFFMSIQAYRCQDFGWEQHVNTYSATQLRALTEHLPEIKDILLLAALAKEAHVSE